MIELPSISFVMLEWNLLGYFDQHFILRSANPRYQSLNTSMKMLMKLSSNFLVNVWEKC